MPQQIVLPEIAESVVEGEILEWHVAEGEHVDQDQPLLEVSSDKVTVEIPSPYAGTVIEHLVKVGDTAPVHAAIATIALDEKQGAAGNTQQPVTSHDSDTPGEDTDENDGDRLSLFKPGPDSAPAVKSPFGQPDRANKAPDDTGAPVAEAVTNRYGRVLAVPSARILARELGIDIQSVSGSGANGRVRVNDVRAFANSDEKQGGQTRTGTPADGSTLPPPLRYETPVGYEDRETRKPLKGVRRAIARQMTASHVYAARTLTVDEADMGRLAQLRTRLKPRAEAKGVRLSYLPFVFKAIVVALREFPTLNTSLDEHAQEIVHKDYYNLGLAVATDAGLVVPVVRDVDHKSLLQLAREINDLADRARNSQLDPAEMKGSSFSVTNIGSIGALFSFPIINVPDAAILGVHSIQKRPVVRGDDDEIVVRSMMYLSLSFDHRLVDGAEAARFCRYLIDLLEDPDALMLEAV